MKDIFNNMIIYTVIMFFLVFLIGIYGIVKTDYFYPIVEENFLNENLTPNATLTAYTELKEDFLFTENPMLIIVNYVGMFGLALLFYSAWNSGYNTRYYNISEIMINYVLLFIVIFYIVVLVINYLINIFVNQLLLVLFSDILNQIYSFNLFYNYFIGIFLICVFISFIGNQIRYYKAIDV